jgi:hypothetical protein
MGAVAIASISELHAGEPDRSESGQFNADDLRAKRDAIVKIEEDRVAAMVNKDVDTLRSVMHPNFVHITTSGSRSTQISDWDSAIEFASFELNDDRCIRFFENIAIVDGTYFNSMRQIDGEVGPTKHARYTRIYRFSSELGSWQLLSHQATTLKNAPLQTEPTKDNRCIQ